MDLGQWGRGICDFPGYFTFKQNNQICLSSTLPEGTVTESPFNGRAKIKVLRSGEGLLGSWVNEKVNVKEDYIKLFGSEPPDVEAIAIMSDADNTRSFVEADYDDFWISRF